MLKSDLKQMSNLLDKKLGENNEKIFERIEGKIDSVEEKIMISTQKEFSTFSKRFDEMDKRFDGIDKTLENKADKSTLLDWADKKILELESDNDKVKYLHIEDWKNLPSASKIKNTLVKEGIK
jgi:acetone carboxylase gamma subunit